MSYLIFLFISLCILKATGLAAMSLWVMFSPLVFLALFFGALVVVGFSVAAIDHCKSRKQRKQAAIRELERLQKGAWQPK